jgi:Fibronectin type III domain
LCATPFAAISAPLYSAPVRLGWSPPNDPNVMGYVLYYGLTNQPATNRIVVGTNLTVTVTNMLANTTYRLYAVSYNAASVESQPSNLLLLTPPAISSIKIASQTNRTMKLDCLAAAGTVCGIQFSSTMLPGSWRTLTNVTANSLGSIALIDASSSRVPKRFYRVALSAQPLLGTMQIKALTNGNVQVSCAAPPDARCRIQYRAKPNTGTWTTLADVTADAEGNVVATDTTARLASSRFYRTTFQ